MPDTEETTTPTKTTKATAKAGPAQQSVGQEKQEFKSHKRTAYTLGYEGFVLEGAGTFKDWGDTTELSTDEVNAGVEEFLAHPVVEPTEQEA